MPLNPHYYQTWFECPVSACLPRFAIITAHHPDGVIIGAEENVGRNRRLCAQLEELGIEYFPVAAGSRDRAHVEDSFGIVCDLATAIDLCNQYEQDAIFWVEDGKIFIIDRHQTVRDYVAQWDARQVG